MKKILVASGLIAALTFAAAVQASPPEPVGISLLRIELKKALLQQEAAPKMTALRQQKFDAIKADTNRPDNDAADAEVDLIQAQTAQAIDDVSVKELQLQLQEALKSMDMPPPAAPAAPARPAAPSGMKPNPPAQPPAPPPEEVASPTDISLLQMDLQKTQLQADAAAKISDNRQKLLASRQARQATAAQVADAQADALASATNARLMKLEVDAAQLRLDAANQSAAPKK